MHQSVLKDIKLEHSTPGKDIYLVGVHTHNGDTIELHFDIPNNPKGVLRFGFTGALESAVAILDFKKEHISLSTTDWTHNLRIHHITTKFKKGNHALLIKKTEGNGVLVKKANITVVLDGEKIVEGLDINIVPEMEAFYNRSTPDICVKRFMHKGILTGMPEYLHIGGWQMPSKASIEDNLKSIFRGLELACEKRIQLLVTPELSLTGLFPSHAITRNKKAIAAVENELQKFMKGLKNAPFLIVGLPIWEKAQEYGNKKVRYNACRVYAPDGSIASTHKKIHPFSYNFWHSSIKLQEFDVYGVPVCMHICHDGRYPETWVLPIMFGARLIVHPMAAGKPRGSIDAFEERSSLSNVTADAFYIRVNSGGGSFISMPSKGDFVAGRKSFVAGKDSNLLAVSSECRQTATSFPLVGETKECLIDANICINDSFGYWPMRSFRASEEIASAYLNLYKVMGGKRYQDSISAQLDLPQKGLI